MKTIKSFMKASELRYGMFIVLFMGVLTTLVAQENDDNNIQPRGVSYLANYYALYEGNSDPTVRGIFEAWNGQISLISTGASSPIVYYIGRDKYPTPFIKFERSRLNGYPIIYSPNDQFRIISKGKLELTANDKGIANINDPAHLIIDKNGRVGIGTNNPSQLLQVNGNALFEDSKVYMGYTHGEDIKISASNLDKYALFVGKGILSEDYAMGPKSSWADHVFDDSYELRSLNEIEVFIKENNHLPEIPSAKEIQEKGYSLHDMNVKLLQKVEELTLYSIQQNKEIEELKKDIEDLKKK